MSKRSFLLKYWGIPCIVLLVFAILSIAPTNAIAGPCIEVTKYCENATGVGMPINFWGTVTNCTDSGRILQDVTVVDSITGTVLGPITLLSLQSQDYSGSYVPTSSPSTNTVTASGTWYSTSGTGYTVFDTASATCETERGGEGCTPGYWKNHLDAWVGLSTGDDFDTTFSVDLFDPDITLGDAIALKGGGVKKLARHGTAALISASHPDVASPYSIAEVIALVQAGDSDALADANELGCPLN